MSARDKERILTFEQAEALVKRARNDVQKMDYITPFKLAQRYNVTVSIAKKILKKLEEEGIIVRYSGTRRSPIYVPKDKLPSFKSLGVGVRHGKS